MRLFALSFFRERQVAPSTRTKSEYLPRGIFTDAAWRQAACDRPDEIGNFLDLFSMAHLGVMRPSSRGRTINLASSPLPSPNDWDVSCAPELSHTKGIMSTENQKSPRVCWICGHSTSLETCKVDEHGLPVHEACHTLKLSLHTATLAEPVLPTGKRSRWTKAG